MKPVVQLPTDPDELGWSIRTHIDREEDYQRLWLLMTTLATHYFAGYRTFRFVGQGGTRLETEYLDEDGNLDYQDHQLIMDIQTIMGQLGRMDVMPTVSTNSNTLDMRRNRAMTQILLDASMNEEHLYQKVRDFDFVRTAYGMCGLGVSLTDFETPFPMRAELEVIHPTELLPFPSTGLNYLNIHGVMRRRYVPITFLHDVYGKRKTNKWLKNQRMYIRRFQYGEPYGYEQFADTEAYGYGGYASTGLGIRNVLGSPSPTNDYTMVELYETFIDGEGGTLGRYIVSSGSQVLEDNDYSKQEVYRPIHYSRMYENGTFYGMGHFQMAFSTQRFAERLRKRVFREIEDADRYGIIIIPEGQINEATAFKNTGDTPKFLKYAPDAWDAAGARPFQMEPFNTGQVSLQAAEYAANLRAGLNPVKDIADDLGRVDSAQGIRLLIDQSQRPMSVVTQGKQQVFQQVYRTLASQVVNAAFQDPSPVPVHRFSLDLAGAVIDFDNETIDFSTNPFPSPGGLDYGIRNSDPDSDLVVSKSILQGAQLKGDLTGSIIQALDEGLDMPELVTQEDRVAYDYIVMAILHLYQDGETPPEKPFILNQNMIKFELQVRVLTRFLQSRMYANASKPVKQGLLMLKQQMELMNGNVLPAGTPSPEDFAQSLDAQSQGR